MIASVLLKSGQTLILRLRLYYLLKPFAGLLHKFYCLSEFSDWQRKSQNPGALRNYTNRYDLYTQIIKTEQLDAICYLEFGVSKGDSMRWWLSRINSTNARFFGFDTFEGIPQDWGTKPKGSYTNAGEYPECKDPRCVFVKGLFQETLGTFLQTRACMQRLVIHLDADLYSSTLFCLFSLAPYLKPGDLLIFDEFTITTHEFRAFMDFQNVFGLTFDFLGESNNYNQVVLKTK